MSPGAMGRYALQTTEQFHRERARRIVWELWTSRLRKALRLAFPCLISACIGALAMYAYLPVRVDYRAERIYEKPMGSLQLKCSPSEQRWYKAICTARGKG